MYCSALAGTPTPGLINAMVGLFYFKYFYLTYIDPNSATLHHPGLFEYLREEKFDAAITEPLDLCGYGMIHIALQNEFFLMTGIFRHLGIHNYAAAFPFATYEGSFDFTGLASSPSYVPGLFA